MSDTILEALDNLTTVADGLRVALETSVSGGDTVTVCCEDMPPYYDEEPTDLTVEEGDPPAPYEEWSEYEADRCLRAWTAVLRIEKAMKAFYDQEDIGNNINLGLATLILALITAPVAVISAIVALLLGSSFTLGTDTLRSTLTLMRDDLVCGIMNAYTATEAKSNVNGVIDASELDILSKAVLKLAYHMTLMNMIFNQSLTIEPGVPTTCDCLTIGQCMASLVGIVIRSEDVGEYTFTNTDNSLGEPNGTVMTVTRVAGGYEGYSLDYALPEIVSVNAGQRLRVTSTIKANDLVCSGYRVSGIHHRLDRAMVYTEADNWAYLVDDGTPWCTVPNQSYTVDCYDGPYQLQYLRVFFRIPFMCGDEALGTVFEIDSFCYEVVDV